MRSFMTSMLYDTSLFNYSEKVLFDQSEVRFCVDSVEKDAQKIGKAIWSHWGIENCLHWTLDITFSGDKPPYD